MKVMTRGETGRNTLFNKFGVKLEKGREYSLNEIKIAQKNIAKEREKFEYLLKDILHAC